jgi:hypothetical protein
MQFAFYGCGAMIKFLIMVYLMLFTLHVVLLYNCLPLIIIIIKLRDIIMISIIIIGVAMDLTFNQMLFIFDVLFLCLNIWRYVKLATDLYILISYRFILLKYLCLLLQVKIF